MPGERKSRRCRQVVVAIDGPVASGKSSVGKAAAAELGLRFLDTGVMYRALTWLALRKRVPVTDTEAVGELAQVSRMTVEHGSVESGDATHGECNGELAGTIAIDGFTPGPDLWSTNVDANVSAVSAIPAVRTAMVRQQREIGHGGGIVMAGRDIGSVVLPNADVKLYIDAAAEERARRRFEQQKERNPNVDFDQVLADTLRRDRLDMERADSPLMVAEGAVVIATDRMDVGKTVEAVVEAIRGAVGSTAGWE
jgi:cytidylate kinase